MSCWLHIPQVSLFELTALLLISSITVCWSKSTIEDGNITSGQDLSSNMRLSKTNYKPWKSMPVGFHPKANQNENFSLNDITQKDTELKKWKTKNIKLKFKTKSDYILRDKNRFNKFTDKKVGQYKNVNFTDRRESAQNEHMVLHFVEPDLYLNLPTSPDEGKIKLSAIEVLDTSIVQNIPDVVHLSVLSPKLKLLKIIPVREVTANNTIALSGNSEIKIDDMITTILEEKRNRVHSRPNASTHYAHTSPDLQHETKVMTGIPNVSLQRSKRSALFKFSGESRNQDLNKFSYIPPPPPGNYTPSYGLRNVTIDPEVKLRKFNGLLNKMDSSSNVTLPSLPSVESLNVIENLIDLNYPTLPPLISPEEFAKLFTIPPVEEWFPSLKATSNGTELNMLSLPSGTNVNISSLLPVNLLSLNLQDMSHSKLSSAFSDQIRRMSDSQPSQSDQVNTTTFSFENLFNIFASTTEQPTTTEANFNTNNNERDTTTESLLNKIKQFFNPNFNSSTQSTSTTLPSPLNSEPLPVTNMPGLLNEVPAIASLFQPEHMSGSNRLQLNSVIMSNMPLLQDMMSPKSANSDNKSSNWLESLGIRQESIRNALDSLTVISNRTNISTISSLEPSSTTKPPFDFFGLFKTTTTTTTTTELPTTTQNLLASLFRLPTANEPMEQNVHLTSAIFSEHLNKSSTLLDNFKIMTPLLSGISKNETTNEEGFNFFTTTTTVFDPSTLPTTRSLPALSVPDVSNYFAKLIPSKSQPQHPVTVRSMPFNHLGVSETSKSPQTTPNPFAIFAYLFAPKTEMPEKIDLNEQNRFQSIDQQEITKANAVNPTLSNLKPAFDFSLNNVGQNLADEAKVVTRRTTPLSENSNVLSDMEFLLQFLSNPQGPRRLPRVPNYVKQYKLDTFFMGLPFSANSNLFPVSARDERQPKKISQTEDITTYKLSNAPFMDESRETDSNASPGRDAVAADASDPFTLSPDASHNRKSDNYLLDNEAVTDLSLSHLKAFDTLSILPADPVLVLTANDQEFLKNSHEHIFRSSNEDNGNRKLHRSSERQAIVNMPRRVVRQKDSDLFNRMLASSGVTNEKLDEVFREMRSATFNVGNPPANQVTTSNEFPTIYRASTRNSSYTSPSTAFSFPTLPPLIFPTFPPLITSPTTKNPFYSSRNNPETTTPSSKPFTLFPPLSTTAAPTKNTSIEEGFNQFLQDSAARMSDFFNQLSNFSVEAVTHLRDAGLVVDSIGAAASRTIRAMVDIAQIMQPVTNLINRKIQASENQQTKSQTPSYTSPRPSPSPYYIRY